MRGMAIGMDGETPPEWQDPHLRRCRKISTMPPAGTGSPIWNRRFHFEKNVVFALAMRAASKCSQGPDRRRFCLKKWQPQLA